MKRKRIRLAAVPHDENAANIWADVVEVDGGFQVQLLHVYPDLSPTAGWWLECDGQEYEVTATAKCSPLILACQPKGAS